MTLPPGVTQEAVNESSDKTMEALADHANELYSLLCLEVEQTVEMRASSSVKSQRLEAIVTHIGKIMAPLVPCSRGCSHCCKMACSISSFDAARIEKFTGIKAARIPITMPDENTQGEMIKKWAGVPCPFLKDNACSIYEVRPLSCRTHYNLSAFPDICNIIDYPGNDVPNLNMRSIWTADVQIHFYDASYGDIRDYFPS